MEGQRIKVPDEVSDEVCPVCGKKLVYKSGRFGRFLACPGFPECKNTRRLVKDTGGLCPKCGSREKEILCGREFNIKELLVPE